VDEVRELPVSRSTLGRHREFAVVVVALSVGVLIMAASLRQHDGDIAGMLALGQDNPELVAHVESVLAREVSTV